MDLQRNSRTRAEQQEMAGFLQSAQNLGMRHPGSRSTAYEAETLEAALRGTPAAQAARPAGQPGWAPGAKVLVGFPDQASERGQILQLHPDGLSAAVRLEGTAGFEVVPLSRLSVVPVEQVRAVPARSRLAAAQERLRSWAARTPAGRPAPKFHEVIAQQRSAREVTAQATPGRAGRTPEDKEADRAEGALRLERAQGRGNRDRSPERAHETERGDRGRG